MTKAMALADVQKRCAELGFDAPSAMNPAHLDAFMREEAGIKPE